MDTIESLSNLCHDLETIKHECGDWGLGTIEFLNKQSHQRKRATLFAVNLCLYYLRLYKFYENILLIHSLIKISDYSKAKISYHKKMYSLKDFYRKKISR